MFSRKPFDPAADGLAALAVRISVLLLLVTLIVPGVWNGDPLTPLHLALCFVVLLGLILWAVF